MMKTGNGVVLVMLLASAGCAAEDHHVQDEGKVCLYASAPEVAGSDGPTQDFDAGQRLYVSVQLDECLSACIRNEAASCSVERDGAALIVSSSFEYSDPDEQEACIALCYAPTALCQSEPLPAGSYAVRHGGVERGTLAIPSTDVTPCLQ